MPAVRNVLPVVSMHFYLLYVYVTGAEVFLSVLVSLNISTHLFTKQ